MSTLVAAVILLLAGVGMSLTYGMAGSGIWHVSDPNPLAWVSRLIVIVLGAFAVLAVRTAHLETKR